MFQAEGTYQHFGLLSYKRLIIHFKPYKTQTKLHLLSQTTFNPFIFKCVKVYFDHFQLQSRPVQTIMVHNWETRQKACISVRLKNSRRPTLLPHTEQQQTQTWTKKKKIQSLCLIWTSYYPLCYAFSANLFPMWAVKRLAFYNKIMISSFPNFQEQLPEGCF